MGNKMISKFRDWKHRLRDRKMFSVVAVALGALAIVSAVLYRQNLNYMQYIENSNRRAFTELTESVRSIDVQMSKAVLTTEPRMLNNLANQITANAAFAKSSLGQLPLNDTNIDKTQKFLAQVGDFTIYLSEKVQKGETLSDEDTNTMTGLLTYADTLANRLTELEDEYLSKTVFFGKMMKLSKEAQAQGQENDQNQFTMLEGDFQNYPSLIYDGPFSDHLTNSVSEFLKGKGEISKEDAEKKARSFIGEHRVKEFNFKSESENTEPVTYSFGGKLTDNTGFSIDITKAGGEILWFLCDRSPGGGNMSMEDGVKKAREYINSLGIKDMVSSYYENQGNVLTANFCPEIDGVRMYPDLIKVRIALDDGEIIGYEAKGYIMSHKERQIPEFAEIDVRKHLNKSVEYDEVKKALIPTQSGTEIYAYEVKGTLNKRDYLVYLNAQNGRTERILLILQNENGILTQ
jgi:germination protein YpeB